MELRPYLSLIASSYDRSAGLQTDTQQALRDAPTHLQTLTPAGFLVIGSGGKGTATFTPWFGFFDPDETTSPEHGLYLAILFSADLHAVSLTLMQGITALDRDLGRREARDRLLQEATAIRGALPPELIADLSTELTLGSSGYRQLAYEAGSLLVQTYPTGDLPPEQILRGDLSRFFQLYQQAIDAKRELLQESPGVVSSASGKQVTPGEDPLKYFKPKDESDYTTNLVGRELVKTRRHERLIRQYGTWLAGKGFTVSTSVHPRDMVVCRDGAEWIVEAKVLYLGNAMNATRSALGQLYTYRHFLYADQVQPGLVALFTESIGGALVSFLETVGVSSVWYEGGQWLGSPMAIEAGLS
jgi:hypothetical protein